MKIYGVKPGSIVEMMHTMHVTAVHGNTKPYYHCQSTEYTNRTKRAPVYYLKQRSRKASGWGREGGGGGGGLGAAPHKTSTDKHKISQE